MQGLDALKKVTKEIGGSRNVVLTKNATNVMDCKDTVLQEANTTRSLINKIHKCQATFLGHVMRRKKVEHLVTTRMIERKTQQGKAA